MLLTTIIRIYRNRKDLNLTDCVILYVAVLLMGIVLTEGFDRYLWYSDVFLQTLILATFAVYAEFAAWFHWGIYFVVWFVRKIRGKA